MEVLGEDHSFCGGGADFGFPVVQAKLQGDVRDIVRKDALKNQESSLIEGQDSRFIKDCRGDAAPSDHLIVAFISLRNPGFYAALGKSCLILHKLVSALPNPTSHRALPVTANITLSG